MLSPIRKTSLQALAAFASDEAEAARLQRLGSPEGKSEYSEWVSRPGRSILEVLQAFPSVKPSLGERLTLDKRGSALYIRLV